MPEFLPTEDEKPTTELFTLEQLAKRHGHFTAPRTSEDTPFSWQHAAADVLHGWAAHAFFKGGEVRLSDADYLAAIEAASTGKTFDKASMRKEAQPEPKKANRK